MQTSIDSMNKQTVLLSYIEIVQRNQKEKKKLKLHNILDAMRITMLTVRCQTHKKYTV